MIPFISISLLVFSPSSFPSFLLDDAFKKRVVVVAFVFALFPTRCSRHVDEEEEIGFILFFFLRAAAAVVVVNRLVEKEQDEEDEDEDVSSEDSTRLAIDARRNIILCF